MLGLSFDALVRKNCFQQWLFFILVHSIDLHLKYLQPHQDLTQCQALRGKKEKTKTEQRGCLGKKHPFFPLKVFENPFGKFEPINKLSDRKPFHFLACPPAAARLNSIQLPPCFQAFSQLVLLPGLYWVGLAAQRNTVPPLSELRLLIKEGSPCHGCSANWVVEKTSRYKVWSYSCENKP